MNSFLLLARHIQRNDIKATYCRSSSSSRYENHQGTGLSPLLNVYPTKSCLKMKSHFSMSTYPDHASNHFATSLRTNLHSRTISYRTRASSQL